MLYLIISLVVMAAGMIVYYFRLFLFGFKVEVDYTVNIQDFIKAKELKGLNLTYVNDLIATIQPLKEFYQPTRDRQAIRGRFRKFGTISSENAIAKLNQDQERPLLALEFLYILAKYRFAKFPGLIVVLGSVWRVLGGGRCVLVLSSDIGRRGLNLYWFGNDWLASVRFAAVRKSL